MATWWLLSVCSLGILLLVPCSLSEKFSLAGSLRPVVGVVGRDVVLPCQLSPSARLPRMEVLWRKIGPVFITVHKYSDEGTQDLPGEGYQTRTELFPQEFSSGNVSLKLKGLQGADAGTYHCFVRNPEWSQEATTELRVSAVAPVFIDVLGPRGQGIRLICRSTGWFPKPELQWVGKNEQNLTMEIVTDITQDRENLYSVVSHVTVTQGEDNGDISCIVRNGLLETERQSAIHLSGDIFPRVSPWLAAFWVLFTLVLVAAGACAYFGYTAKRKVSQKKRSKEEALLNLETEKKTWEADYQDMRQLLDAQRKALESECDNLRKTIESQEKEKKKLSTEFDNLRETIASEVKKNKQLESEHQELSLSFESLKSEHELLKSVWQKLRNKFESKEKKDMESECAKLRETIASEVKKNKQLESEHQVLSKSFESLKSEHELFKSVWQKLRNKFESKEKEDMESECQELHQTIDVERKAVESECDELCEKLDAQRKAFEAECSKLREMIESQEKENKKLKSECDKLRETIGSDKKGRKSLKKLMEEVRESKDIPEEEKKSLLEKISKLDKESDELRGQIDGKENRNEEEWRMARTYADDITLNPDTAQPNLSISEDKKKFIHEPHPQKFPPTPERFDATVCVLGKNRSVDPGHSAEKARENWSLP